MDLGRNFRMTRRKRRTAMGPTVLVTLAFLTGCAAPPDDLIRPPAAAAPTAHAQKFMVASADRRATLAGLEVLRNGGSALDAAVAVQMVLTLVEPQSSGIGGGAFLLHFNAQDGKIEAYDGREWAPASATPRMFLGTDGKPRKFADVRPGGLSVGVPGVLRMLELAHKDHGKRPWAELFDPAINLSDKGFAISPRLAQSIANARGLNQFSSARNYFFDSEGKPKAAGMLLTNAQLAETFRTVAAGGADAFYTGPIAEAIRRTIANADVNPAAMSAADIANYSAKRRAPACLFYRTWLICGMPPPSSGGITTLEILGMLQKFDLPQMEPGSAGAVHLALEASRIAFADRDTYIADPDFIPVPTAGMLDPGYLALRASEISPERSIGKADPGMPGPGAFNYKGSGELAAGNSTTHFVIVDGDGNAVSMTSSIESAFGARLMTRGFLLNNQLTDFSFTPEANGAPVANRPGPRKRPRSSMAPTLVIGGDGKLVMAVGSPGGSRIIGYVAKTLIAALDWNKPIQEAIDFPHFINRNGKTDVEKGTVLEKIKPALEGLGHNVRVRPLTSGLNGIRIRGDGLHGGADKRREGVALGD